MAFAGGVDIYTAFMFAFLGLAAISIACGVIVFRLARRILPTEVAAIAGAAGGIGPILPIFGSSSLDLLGPQLYVLALATANWWLSRPSPVSRTFLALSASTSILLLALLLLDSRS